VMLAGAALAAPSVEIRNAAARVVVIPEQRPDVAVQVVRTNPRLPLHIDRSFGERTVLDGGINSSRIQSCDSVMHRIYVRVWGVGRVAYEDLPVIVVRTPLDAKVGASGAVFGSVSRSDSLELANAGCGDWTVGNVRGELKISQAGSGDTRAGSAGKGTIHVAGSGDISTQTIAGGLTVGVAGSGDVTAASIDGPLNVRIAGSGDVKIGGGHATSADVHIAGSGDMVFKGRADSLKANVAGSGDVDVAHVSGPVSKSIVGSGDVNVGPS